MKVLVTGGCGFIGSNFIRYLLTNPEVKMEIIVVNVDKKTYAGKGKNISHMNLSENKKYKFILADISDKDIMKKVFEEERPEIVFNFAAESHVDRSIIDSDSFEKSNFLGACTLFKIAMEENVKRFIQISTDEVYGSIKQGFFSEDAQLNPSSPYSATKASAEITALSYFKTYNFPVIITRSANNYGEYQFPEKLLPLFITNLIEGKKVPLMWSEENPGLNVRDWLHVEDNCRAIWFISQKGNIGEIYNIPGENERTNIQMTKLLLQNFGYSEERIEKVIHRKGHDFRYAISGEKLKNLGFVYLHKDLEKEIKELIFWYRHNTDWWRILK